MNVPLVPATPPPVAELLEAAELLGIKLDEDTTEELETTEELLEATDELLDDEAPNELELNNSTSDELL